VSDSESIWRDLEPDPTLLRCLDYAGPRPLDGDIHDKRNWGKHFADACAVMFADALRANPEFRKLEIRPAPDGTGTESLTGVGGGGQKKVDVIASTLASGLQVAISLKAENFSDSGDAYGKNLKNRMYELQDEVRAIHEYQPRAYVVGVLFLPLDSCADRSGRSSFTRSVGELRSRSGRIDFSLPTQLNRLDWSVIGLYVPEDIEGGSRRGVVRYFDAIEQDPPLRGRPRVPTTLSLQGVIEKIANEYRQDPAAKMRYAEPEPDVS
jgi:hypothetical protein